MLINIITSQIQAPTAASPPITTTTISYTLANTDVVVIANAAALTLTLPAAATAGAGRVYWIKNGASGTATTVVVSGGGTIDGVSSYTGLAVAYAALLLVSNGTEWMIL